MFAIREEVSTHSRPKAAGYAGEDLPEIEKFQHTAARRRLERLSNARYQISRFNTQPPEGGWDFDAGQSGYGFSFNTQPPEGGWKSRNGSGRAFNGFNTQPPEGGWLNNAKF